MRDWITPRSQAGRWCEMTYKEGNWSFREVPLKDGDIVEGGNFAQLQPDTEICASVKDLTIRGGNFMNCKPQPTWVITGGLWCQESLCSHGNPILVRRGLPVCKQNCEHRSAQKIERPLDEQGYRKKRAEALDPQTPITLDDLSVEKHVDDDGVTVQKFKVREHVYKHTVTKTGRKHFEDCGRGWFK